MKVQFDKKGNPIVSKSAEKDNEVVFNGVAKRSLTYDDMMFILNIIDGKVKVQVVADEVSKAPVTSTTTKGGSTAKGAKKTKSSSKKSDFDREKYLKVAQEMGFIKAGDTKVPKAHRQEVYAKMGLTTTK